MGNSTKPSVVVVGTGSSKVSKLLATAKDTDEMNQKLVRGRHAIEDELETISQKLSTGNHVSQVSEFPAKLIEAVRRYRFTDQELVDLKAAIDGRFPVKACAKCGKLKASFEGYMTWLDGDMSKPKRFVCNAHS